MGEKLFDAVYDLDFSMYNFTMSALKKMLGEQCGGEALSKLPYDLDGFTYDLIMAIYWKWV